MKKQFKAPNEILKALELFNEKANKLDNSRFIQQMYNDSGVSISFKKNQDGTYTSFSERRGTDQEAIEAFVLNFRFFIQDNEKSSFRNLATFYSDAPIANSLKSRFKNIRSQLNKFLDSQSIITFNDKPLTRRKIMDGFIYGNSAHVKETQKANYDAWTKIPPSRVLLENEFSVILATFYQAIAICKTINEEAIEQIRTTLNLL